MGRRVPDTNATKTPWTSSPESPSTSPAVLGKTAAIDDAVTVGLIIQETDILALLWSRKCCEANSLVDMSFKGCVIRRSYVKLDKTYQSYSTVPATCNSRLGNDHIR